MGRPTYRQRRDLRRKQSREVVVHTARLPHADFHHPDVSST